MATELFVGVVAPVGVPYATAVGHLVQRLTRLGVDVEPIKLSELIKAVPGADIATYVYEDERVTSYMSAGNKVRRILEDEAALAQLAAVHISKLRKKREAGERADKPVVYLLLSLKTPAEVKYLRETYDDAFVAISLFQPRENRVTTLAQKISRSHGTSDIDKYRSASEELLKRDEDEGVPYGQCVSDAFAESDFFANVTSRADAHTAMDRFVDVVFGHPFVTPTVDEYGMFLAWGVSLRSADLSRQVGASACDNEGNLIAVGCNDVPRAGGGQYWPGKLDMRDFQLGYDSSAIEKQHMVGEILTKLKDGNWLAAEKAGLTPEKQLAVLEKDLKGAAVTRLLEFGRIIHAEMAAVADAARRGLPLNGATLYCTTFPCHVCARHLVAAGFSRVVYIEPYPKSRARDLHADSIAFDGPGELKSKVRFEGFTGVAPRRYGDMFKMSGIRKTKDGVAVAGEASVGRLRLKPKPQHYLWQEARTASAIDRFQPS